MVQVGCNRVGYVRGGKPRGECALFVGPLTVRDRSNPWTRARWGLRNECRGQREQRTSTSRCDPHGLLLGQSPSPLRDGRDVTLLLACVAGSSAGPCSRIRRSCSGRAWPTPPTQASSGCIPGRSRLYSSFNKRSGVRHQADDKRTHMRFALAGALVLTLTAVGFAQQTVPRGRGGVPVAPNGIPAVPLPDKPLEFETAEGQNIRVVVVARGMSSPWSMVWLPDGDMLITQRTGQLRRLREGVLDPTPVAGVPQVVAGGLGGLMEITLHPQFATNQFVYLSYPKPVGPHRRHPLAGARWRRPGWWSAKRARGRARALERHGAGGRQGCFRRPDRRRRPGAHGLRSRRQVVCHDRRRQQRRPGSEQPGGQGSSPERRWLGAAGQPVREARRLRAEVYTLGHRSSLGMAVHPGTGEIWQHENGPERRRRDQHPEAGRQLRLADRQLWADLSRAMAGAEALAREFRAAARVLGAVNRRIGHRVLQRETSCRSGRATSSSARCASARFPGTGHLQRILFNEQMEELRRESLLVPLQQRIRDVRQGPDELLYVLTDDPKDGALLRIEPAP